jgi:hypothetical protein
MTQSEILDKLESKELKPEELTTQILSDSTLLPDVLKGISSDKARIKFGCAKILSRLSQDNPELLYSESKLFIQLLDSENNIIKWNAMDVLANLTKVDEKKKFDKIFDQYYDGLEDESMVTAAHVIDNSEKIIEAKPYLTKDITTQLLRVENIQRNQECKNILMGKTILAFDKYYDKIENKEEVISFVKRQLNNTRNATKNKAEKFLKKRNG